MSLRRRLAQMSMQQRKRSGSPWSPKFKYTVGILLALYLFYLLYGQLRNENLDPQQKAVDQDSNIRLLQTHKDTLETLIQYDKGNNQAARKMSASQTNIDYIATALEVKYEIMNNLIDDRSPKVYQAKITFTNTGNQDINPTQDWKIYFYSIRNIEPKNMTADGVLSENKMFTFNYINGLLYSMTPTRDFTEMKSGQSTEIIYHAHGCNTARSDNFPNWYVASSDGQAKVLKSTEGYDATFVKPFESPAQYKRSIADMYEPFNPGQRYERNEMEDLEGAPLPIIPTPKEIRLDSQGSSVLVDSSSWVIFADSNLQKEAKFLSDSSGIKQSANQPSHSYIKLASSSSATDESYTLDIDPETKVIVLTGKPAGVFYAIQSLLSLLLQYQNKLPKTIINDSPRFPYRGLMLDVSRNFHSKESVIQLLDAMSTYKLNKFHFHLTDDEGWRLEIPGLPELTEIGGKRGHDLKEESCILPQLGSGPVAEGLGCGYYSIQDYKDIVQYAADRHIEVIPEIDLPGHSHAAIKAMELRRKRYLAKGDQKTANEFLLSDPEDKSKYRSVQGFRDNVINPGLESTFSFLQHIISSIKEMHKNIKPLKTLHFGGDEVPVDVWSASPACSKLKETHPDVDVTSRMSIMEYFLRRANDIASKLEVNIQGWEDAFYVGQEVPHARSEFPSNTQLTANIWKNTWEFGNAHHMHEMANSGYKIVLSPATHLYFDHPHEPDPEDRGLYWATRFVDTKKVYNFQPDSFYDNIDVTLNGKPLDKKTACSSGMINCPPLHKPENLLGLQAQLWTETVRTKEHLQEMLFPRLLALAERAWYKAPWESIKDKHQKGKMQKESYEKFSNTLGYRELKRLEKMGIQFHLPLPGVRIENGMLKVNSAYPGLNLQYTSNEGKTWHNLKSFAKLSGTIYITTASYNGSRKSRVIKVDIK